METNKEKLRKKINLKKNQRAAANTVLPEFSPPKSEEDFLSMMDQVNKVMKTNPQLVQQVSKCVSKVMGNKDLMDSLSQISNTKL